MTSLRLVTIPVLAVHTRTDRIHAVSPLPALASSAAASTLVALLFRKSRDKREDDFEA